MSVENSVLDTVFDDETSTILDDTETQRRGGKPRDKVWEHFRTVDIPNNSHKGAQCLFCSQAWKRGKPNEMKAHLALRCPMVPYQTKLEYLRTVTNEEVSEQEQLIQSQSNNNGDSNTPDIKRADRALVRLFVCCGIPFSIVDSPFFRDFVKTLCFGYEPPRRTALSTSSLDAETASIALKIEEELRLSKNLTLGIDSWTNPLGQSIYAFVIITQARREYIYSIEDFSSERHTAAFNEEKILKVIESVGNNKFSAIVTDAEAAMQAAKKRVLNKYPHIMAVRCVAHHINLVTKDIISVEWSKQVLRKCQKIVSFFHGAHRAGAALRDEIKNSFSGGNLKSSVKTRWSTAWDICESILRLENSIKYILEETPDIFINSDTIKNIIQSRQFWYNVEQLKTVLSPAKKAIKALESSTATFADCFVEIVKIAQAISQIPLPQNNFKSKCIAIFNKRWREFDINIYLLAFFLHPNYRASCFQRSIFKHVSRTALNIWKEQFGGGLYSSNLLLTQLSLYRRKEDPFDGPYMESANTLINWWSSLELETGQDPIRRLALKMHSIVPHNAHCERVFSILGWFLGKRRTKIGTKRLQAMVQMHSYLVTNAKSELKYLGDGTTSEELDEVLNQVALAISENDLFGDDDDLSVDPIAIFEDHVFDEVADLEGVNDDTLEIADFIDLSASLLSDTGLDDNNDNDESVVINHGDPNFDVDELINNFDLI